MGAPCLDQPLRTEAEAMAERIYNEKLRWRNCDHYTWAEAPEWIRKLAFSEARVALAAARRESS